jgi:16S rRNA processing protein RimM
MKPETLIEIGRIASPHGLCGEVHYRPHDPGSPLPVTGMTVFVGAGQGPRTRLVVSSRRPEAKGALLAFDGVGDRNSAERLRALSLEVARSAMPPPGPGEFYYQDILGASVSDRDGAEIGRVVDVFHAATDVLVVRGPDGEWMVPVVEDRVLAIGPDGVVVDAAALDEPAQDREEGA